MKTIVQFLLFSLVPAFYPLSQADSLNFETTRSSIIEKLSRPVVPEQMITSRPVNRRGSSVSTTKKEKRGLVRIKLIDPASGSEAENIIEERTEVPLKQEQPHVNLKIEFNVNSYTIKPSSQLLLAELRNALTSPELDNKNFYINGHTDSDGDPNYNLKLSLKRALSVKHYLIAQQGIAAERLTVIGYGEGMPLENNENSINKQINRRVEVVLR